MINIITGRPGGGKSYEAVAYHILPALEKGRKVITNLPLQLDMFVQIFGAEVLELIKVVDGQLNDFGSMDRPFSKYEDYINDWRNKDGQGPLYVIDECHMVLPNRKLDSKILEFYSLHRHYGIDIDLISQNVRKIHKDIRDMIEIQYICQKNTALGSQNSYTKKVKQGVSGEVVNTSIRKYKPDYFKFYKSHTASNSAVIEDLAGDITPLWKRWPVIGAAIMFSIAFCLVLFIIFKDKKEIAVKTPELQQIEIKVATKDKIDQVDFKKPVHPLEKFTFFVTGQSKQFVRASHRDDDIPDSALNFYRVYIDVYENNKKLFSVNQHDLIKLGYTFKKMTDCFYEISYNDYVALITCGEIAAPKTGIEALGVDLI
uniref:Zona occludens toxin n=1 Tax=Aliivibrio wodanis TaxID=80852 RepID=A0A5Q4YZI8_9GAMM|nr:Zona occludens toxin [Aliivibrio wodanis]VVV04123.1 Zona occludens toxin [Aliivibrio wodanis]VVV04133.1 Zona occludens toxin [Aliivibrio wodanis]